MLELDDAKPIEGHKTRVIIVRKQPVMYGKFISFIALLIVLEQKSFIKVVLMTSVRPGLTPL